MAWLLALYGLVAVTNLAAAAVFREPLRKVTKCLLAPALIALYVVAADRVLVWVVLALAFCWLGDLLLLWKDQPRFFRLGLAAFLLGHVFYIVAFFVLAGTVHGLALAVSVAVAVPATVAIVRVLRPDDAMRVPVIAYAVVIMAMSVAALQLLVVAPGAGAALVFAGSLVFLFSDAFMAYNLFHRRPKYFNVITMAPYILAQGLIVTGLVLV